MEFYTFECYLMFLFPVVFIVFFRRSLKTLHWIASLGTNFVRWWTLPRNAFNCLHVFEAFRFWMASVFLTSGFIPFWFTANPSPSIAFFAKWHFYKFMLRFSWSRFGRHLKIFSLWFLIPRPKTMIMSSKKLYVSLRPFSVLSIAFWRHAR